MGCVYLVPLPNFRTVQYVERVMDPYIYKAVVKRVIDGDSVVLDIDCGFSVVLQDQSTRLYGVDTPETRMVEGGNTHLKVLGQLAKERVQALLPTGKEVHVRSHLDKRGKFGRILVEVFLEDEECSLNQILIDQRYGVAYEGQSKQEILLKHLANVEHWRNTGRLEEE
jgi:endonuclease YncB( thermonuclease family)